MVNDNIGPNEFLYFFKQLIRLVDIGDFEVKAVFRGKIGLVPFYQGMVELPARMGEGLTAVENEYILHVEFLYAKLRGRKGPHL